MISSLTSAVNEPMPIESNGFWEMFLREGRYEGGLY